MKKLLLSTSVLALSLGMSSAYAMGGAEISISGNSKWTYTSKSVDDKTNGKNGTSFGIGNSVTFDSSLSSDSGLSYGTSLTITTSGGEVKDDGMKLFVSGDFGEIRTGSGGAGDTFGIGAKGAVDGESGINNVGSFVALAGDSSISYYTPSINSFKGGLTFTDAGEESEADSSEFGLSFSTDIGGNALTLKYALADQSGDGKTSGGTGSTEATSYGASYAVGDFTFTVAANEKTVEDASGEATSDIANLGFGLKFGVSDDVTFGVYSVDGEDKAGDTEFSESAASLTYVVAPGLSTNLAYTDSENGGTSSSATTAYIKVAF